MAEGYCSVTGRSQDSVYPMCPVPGDAHLAAGLNARSRCTRRPRSPAHDDALPWSNLQDLGVDDFLSDHSTLLECDFRQAEFPVLASKPR